MPSAVYYGLMVLGIGMMFVSILFLMIGLKRSNRSFTIWMSVFLGGFLIVLLMMRGKISTC
ncbi:hypothetical protein [Negativibacillus massiliensis]|uniref:hypothetical protein n=1 Tax=Negativibacillus massiliensis TaxID=1871035 RepID=UPI003AF1F1A7